MRVEGLWNANTDKAELRSIYGEEMRIHFAADTTHYCIISRTQKESTRMKLEGIFRSVRVLCDLEQSCDTSNLFSIEGKFELLPKLHG